MKKFHLFLIYFMSFICFPSLIFAGVNGANQSSDAAQHLHKIYAQDDLIEAGNKLVDQGMFDQAIAKYEEAAKPIYLNYEYDKATPIGNICAALKFQHKYEESLKRWQWFMNFNPKGDGWVSQKRELEALLEAQKSGNTAKLYEHIKYLKEKQKKWMPPNGYHTSTAGVASVIIQIYDHIGDKNGGIAFCDEVMSYFASGKGGKADKEIAFTPKDPYYPIKQAFEQDKKEGFKGCLEAKPGDACMGRATKALIKSNYFPW